MRIYTSFLTSLFLVLGPSAFSQKTDILPYVQSQFTGKWQVDYADVKKKRKPKQVGNYYFEVTSVQMDNPKWKGRHLKFEGTIFTAPVENGRIEVSDSTIAFAFTQTIEIKEDAKKTTRIFYYSGVIDEGELMFMAYEPGNEDRKLFRWYGIRPKE